MDGAWVLPRPAAIRRRSTVPWPADWLRNGNRQTLKRKRFYLLHAGWRPAAGARVSRVVMRCAYPIWSLIAFIVRNEPLRVNSTVVIGPEVLPSSAAKLELGLRQHTDQLAGGLAAVGDEVVSRHLHFRRIVGRAKALLINGDACYRSWGQELTPVAAELSRDGRAGLGGSGERQQRSKLSSSAPVGRPGGLALLIAEGDVPLLLVVVVPVVRPEPSRNVLVPLLSVVTVPVVRPLASRNVVGSGPTRP